ncbi:ATP-binding protein [Roseococcus sp. DSY-14]|uniref:hybrid sensor histidine kinase/response regulator n=1 Tax=Roseococcus sp. DSY-14 TaxID=3369650 RepID=UPI00387B96BA
MPNQRLLLLVAVITAGVLGLVALATQRLLDRGDALSARIAADATVRGAVLAHAALEREFTGMARRLDALDYMVRTGAAGAGPGGMDRLAVHAADATLPENAVRLPHATEADLALSGPLRRRDGWAIEVTRHVPMAEGTPVTVAAILTAPELAAILAPVAGGAGLRLRLETADGLVLGADAAQAALIGRRLQPPTAWAPEGLAMRRLERQGGGWAHAARAALGFQGLWVVAVLPDATAMADWLRLRGRVKLVATGFMALVALLGMLAALLALARQQARRVEEEGMQRLQAAVAGLPDGFVMWDAADRLVLWNPRLEELYRSTPTTLRRGESFEALSADALRGQPDAEAQLAARMGQRGILDRPFERTLPDGTVLRIHQRHLPDGALVGIHTDVTEEHRARAELAAARDAAAGAMRARSLLLSHVSHELRTPLGSLLRITEALRADPALPAEARERAALADAAARHVLALANDVLDLAAMEAGRLALQEEPVAAREPFEAALRILAPTAAARRVRLVARLEGLPAGLRADATRLRQILVNLLGNAVKFTPEGSDVTLVAGTSGGRLRIAVEDQGAGVPPEARNALFSEFARLDGAVEGTGLGLAISARLVALMGGAIAVEDGPRGHGARFVVDLPLVPATPPPPPDAPRPLRLRVLAVDDAPANLAVVKAMLAPTGIEVATAASGAEALAALQDAAAGGAPFDAVLMDVMMPVMDGLEATRRLRALPDPLGRTPVIALTARVFPEDLDATRAAGMDGHLSKPIERRRLLAALEALAAP